MNLPDDVLSCLLLEKSSLESFTTIYQVDENRNFIQSFDHLAKKKENVHSSLSFFITDNQITFYYNFSIANVGHASFDVFKKRDGVWKKKKSQLTKIR